MPGPQYPCNPSLLPPGLPSGPEDECPSATFTAGAGAYFIKPRFSSNPAFVASNNFNSAATGQQDFTYEFTASPRVWLALTKPDGFGIRARWWRFDQIAQPSSFVNSD